ncbi:hypothetical protein QQ045_023156 [Rhodiola kirilowii]
MVFPIICGNQLLLFPQLLQQSPQDRNIFTTLEHEVFLVRVIYFYLFTIMHLKVFISLLLPSSIVVSKLTDICQHLLDRLTCQRNDSQLNVGEEETIGIQDLFLH